MEVKYEDLVRRLIKSTKDGNIEWKQSSTECQYRLELKSATFVIDETSLMLAAGVPIETTYTLSMYNNNSVEIPIAEAKDSPDSSSDYLLLHDLYYAAKESWLKETETIKKVMAELDGLDLPF